MPQSIEFSKDFSDPLSSGLAATPISDIPRHTRWQRRARGV
jgi:hypothetical protein